MNQKRLFIACIVALVATAFGFIIRALILGDLQADFNLSETQKGVITGAGLYPFAISIILFSLVIDRLGYGKVMAFAFVGHIVSAALTIYAGYGKSYNMLYAGTLLCALANGAVEAVINPVTATLFPKNKTHYLNILHAGWPGGLVLGGLLIIAIDHFSANPGEMGRVAQMAQEVAQKADWQLTDWRFKVGLILIPTVLYGILLIGCRFPVSEREAAGVSDREMLKEFGGMAATIVSAILVFGFADDIAFLKDQSVWFKVAIVLVLGGAFGAVVGSFGRPMFALLLLIMAPLATTELGTDGWISDLLSAQMQTIGRHAGWVLVYTSFIMFILRFFAGPIVHRISPLGLLAVCAAIACGGLLWLSKAQGLQMIFAAATLYGIGKTFFWPTMLGVTAEQFPKGGALTLNTVGGVGMLSVGLVGGVLLGTIQDQKIDKLLLEKDSALHARVTAPAPQTKFMIEYKELDQTKLAGLDAASTKTIEDVRTEAKQTALATVAYFPAVMFACYVLLILYFKLKGGYKPVELPSLGTEAAA